MSTYDPETLSLLQACELAILDEVATLCARHDIPWFLDAGTLLGAVRHQGFIPWDDDMDIGMLREDYERFLAIAPQELPGWLRLENPQVNLAMAAPFSKVCMNGSLFLTDEIIEAGFNQGIYIDVFPYDVVPEDQEARSAQRRKLKVAIQMSYLYYSSAITVPDRGVKGTLEKGLCFCAHQVIRRIATPETLRRQLAQAQTCGRDDVDESDPLLLMDPYRPPVRKSLIFPLTTVSFCGRAYPAPGQTERFLENIFGDWRQLPPVEKRKSHRPVKLIFPQGHAKSSES